jgi:uncharacterized protein DUF4350
VSGGGERFWTRETRVFVAIGVVVALLATFAGGRGESDGPVAKPSTFVTRDGGLRALYLAADELGLPVGQWMRPLPDDDGAMRAIAIVAPSEALEKSEASWLRAWVERGGRLFYVASESGTDEVVKAFGYSGRIFGGEPTVHAVRGSSDLADRLLEGTPDDAGCSRTFDPDGAPATGTVLLAANGSMPAATTLSVGLGRAVLFADALGLVNEHVREPGVATLALRAFADLAAGDTLWFDEFHHGFDERGSPTRAALRFVGGTHVGWAIAQLALIGVLALAFAGIRLGRPLPATRAPRRSSVEHVEALASAYRESGAMRRPASLLVDGLRVQLGARSRDELRARLAAIAAARGEAAAAAEEVARVEHSPAAASDLVALVQSIDRIVEEENRVEPR